MPCHAKTKACQLRHSAHGSVCLSLSRSLSPPLSLLISFSLCLSFRCLRASLCVCANKSFSQMLSLQGVCALPYTPKIHVHSEMETVIWGRASKSLVSVSMCESVCVWSVRSYELDRKQELWSVKLLIITGALLLDTNSLRTGKPVMFSLQSWHPAREGPHASAQNR